MKHRIKGNINNLPVLNSYMTLFSSADSSDPDIRGILGKFYIQSPSSYQMRNINCNPDFLLFSLFCSGVSLTFEGIIVKFSVKCCIYCQEFKNFIVYHQIMIYKTVQVPMSLFSGGGGGGTQIIF